MKNWIRAISFLSAAVLTTTLASCGEDSSSSDSSSSASSSSETSSISASGKLTDTPVTYSFLRPENSLQPYTKDCETVQKIEELTGIKLDVIIVPASDWATKMNTLMATDSMPDFFRLWTDAKEVSSSGSLLPLDDLIKQYAPNIQNLYDTIPNLDKSAINGHIYALPTIRMDQNYEVGATPNIRVDLLEEQGLDVPTTWDELYTVLKAFKEAYPNSIPWGSRGDYNILRSYTSCITSLGAHYDLHQDESGTWQLGRLEESYKEALTFMNKCYTEGILDNEYIITSAQDWKSNLSSGKYLFYYDNPTFINSFNTTLKGTDPDARIEPIPLLKNSAGDYVSYGYADHTFNEYGFSTDIENPELAIKFFDWLYSEEGALLMNYGIEGEDYEITDGTPHFTQSLISDYSAKSSDPYYAAASEKGFGLLFFTPAWYSHAQNDFMTSAPDDVTAQYINTVYTDQMDSILDQPVQPPYTDTEAEEIQKVKQNIEDYSTTEINQFVTGERSLDEFDDFVKELKAKGADDLVRIANEAETRYQASK